MNDADRIRAKMALALNRQSADHPPLEQLVAWHEKGLEPSQSESVQAHVAQCDHCFALWCGLVELAPEMEKQVASAPARRVRWWHFAAPAAALGVVAVSFWIGLAGSAPLPDYSLDVRGGLDERGGTDSSVIVRDETLLQIMVAPASAIDGPIDALVFAQNPAGLIPLPVTMDVTDKGVASLDGIVGSDFVIPPGTQRLLIVVGRADQLPDENRLLEALGEQSKFVTHDWQVFAVPIRD